MLRNLFSTEGLIQLLYFIPIFLITITVHEVAHGYSAYKLGDPTARNLGRLTLNPVKHIDPFGFIMLVILGFGWAKPVPINPRNFKNPQKGMALSALAGPMANFSMAVIGAILMRLIIWAFLGTSGESAFANKFFVSAITFFYSFFYLNIYFGIFNLLPLPPLDGSRIVNYFLPASLSYKYAQFERYSFIILMILMYTKILTIPLTFFGNLIKSGINFLLDFIPFLPDSGVINYLFNI